MPQSKWVREHGPCRAAIQAMKGHYESRTSKRLQTACLDCGSPIVTPFRQLIAAAVNGQVRAPERCAGCRP